MTDPIIRKPDEHSQPDDHSTNIIYSLPFGELLVSNPLFFWSLEERAGHGVLLRVAERLSLFLEQSARFQEQQLDYEYTKLIRMINSDIQKLLVVIDPRKGTRDLMEFIGEAGIVSAGMVCRYHVNRALKGKRHILDRLRELEIAGVLKRYSYEPVKVALKSRNLTPFASLAKTEFYGYPGLKLHSYEKAIEFYTLHTETAEEVEEDHSRAKIKKKRIADRIKTNEANICPLCQHAVLPTDYARRRFYNGEEHLVHKECLPQEEW